MNGREVVFTLTLHGRSQSLETCKGFRVVHALFEKVQFGLAYSHLPVHFEHALTGIIEWVVAHWFECQVLRMASKHIERLWLRVPRMPLIHVWSCSLLFIINYLTSTLVEVDVEEDHLLDVGHVEDLSQIEVDLVSLIPEVLVGVLR